MKKLLALCGSIATMLLFTPLTILAAESGESSTATVPIWLCIPFAGLLLCIAVLPLVKPEWWEKNQPLAVAAWSLLFIIPFAAKKEEQKSMRWQKPGLSKTGASRAMHMQENGTDRSVCFPLKK